MSRHPNVFYPVRQERKSADGFRDSKCRTISSIKLLRRQFKECDLTD